jgi:hypothetical protein
MATPRPRTTHISSFDIQKSLFSNANDFAWKVSDAVLLGRLTYLGRTASAGVIVDVEDSPEIEGSVERINAVLAPPQECRCYYLRALSRIVKRSTVVSRESTRNRWTLQTLPSSGKVHLQSPPSGWN